jgi:oxygen-independent coproporphyrinogen-3 oxidase
VLTAAGMAHYEISNFAYPGCESRHNLKYWLCAPYYGIGPGAHACHGGQRTAVPRDLAAFCAADTQPETVTDAVPLTDSERIMLGLRLRQGIRYGDYPDAAETVRKAAKPLLPTYLTEHGGMLSMTLQGWLVSNAVLAHLLKDVL